MKAYWAQLKPRERLMLMACGGVLLLVFIYLLMIEPVFSKTTELRSSVAKQEQLVHWMKQKSAEAKQLQRANRSGDIRKQSILGLIDRTAKAGKLGDSMKRVEPDGSNRVRVWLENAAFDDVARWLTKLQNRHGLKAISIIIDAEENSAGRVSARLVFEGAA